MMIDHDPLAEVSIDFHLGHFRFFLNSLEAYQAYLMQAQMTKLLLFLTGVDYLVGPSRLEPETKDL